MAERDNRPRWDPSRRGTYEAWHLTFTDPRTGHGYWIRTTIHAPKQGSPVAASWFARFDPADPSATFAIHRRFPTGYFEVRRSEGEPVDYRVSAGRSVLAPGLAQGSLSGGGRDVSWDLSWPTGDVTYQLMPGWVDRAAPTSACAPNVDARVSGVITVDDEPVGVADAPGQQGHLVGTRHAERWAWAHCSDVRDERVVIHALTAQGRRGPLLTPYVTSIGVLWESRWIHLSAIERRRPFGLGIWHVDVGDRRHRLTGRIEAPTRDMVRARYEDPDGTERFCHNSEIASSRLALFERKAGGFEEVALFESRGTTHAEWAGRTPATAVEREHIDVTPP